MKNIRNTFWLCFGAMFVSLSQSCAGFKPAENNFNLKLLRDTLIIRQDSGYSPLDYPIAVHVNGSTVALNGPCVDVKIDGCVFKQVDEGHFLIRKSPDEYSIYGYTDMARTVELIAHEEFHYFKSMNSQDDFSTSGPDRHFAMRLDIDKAMALIKEINAIIALTQSHSEKDLDCTLDIVRRRQSIFSNDLNVYFNNFQEKEGLAHYVGFAYRASLTGESPEERMVRELRFPGTYDTGDVFAMLHILSYPLGGLKARYSTRYGIPFGLLINGRVIDDISNSCATLNAYQVDNSTVTVDSIMENLEEAHAVIDEFYGSRRKFDIYRLHSPMHYVSFNKRYRMSGVSVLSGDVSLLLADGSEVLSNTTIAVFLECELDDYIIVPEDVPVRNAEMVRSIAADDNLADSMKNLISCNGNTQ